MHWLNFLSEMDFKYLSKEFSDDLLKLVKQKDCIHINIYRVLKSFLKINYLMCVNFIAL